MARVTRKLPFQWLLHQGEGEGATSFPGLLHFSLDPYPIILSIKQGGIKHHFLSLWNDSTWYWTIGEHSTYAKLFALDKNAWYCRNEIIYIKNIYLKL